MKNEKLINDMCKAMSDKRASDITIIDVEGLSDVADAFIIASGKNAPQVKAIFDNLEAEMEKQGVFARRKEGVAEGRWIAVDYFDVIVHIFQEEARKFYQLEKLWINDSNVTKYTD